MGIRWNGCESGLQGVRELAPCLELLLPVVELVRIGEFTMEKQVGDFVEGAVVAEVVDAVSDVLNVEESDIDSPPDFGGGVDTSFIKGMAKAGENLITLLDIERLLDLDAIPAETN